MTQDERSERSRAAILDAALELFSRQGYRATSIRDIASQASASTGSVYHHFRDKESIFATLLSQFRIATEQPEFPLNRVLAGGAFPNRVEEMGQAAREIIVGWRAHIALIYVDVVEFEGSHIRQFYSDMASRCEAFIASHRSDLQIDERIRTGIPPAAAMLMTIRIFIYYFVVELLFGVPNHYGMNSDDAIRVISDILQHGMLEPREA